MYYAARVVSLARNTLVNFLRNAWSASSGIRWSISTESPKSKAKPYKLTNGEGLYLLVHPNSSKYWRLKYRIGNKEKVYAIGAYPHISLAAAREARFETKKLIRTGIDPNEQKRIAELEDKTQEDNSFSSVANEWHSKNLNNWSARQAKKLKNWIEIDITPVIGHLPINEIKPMQILQIMRRIEAREAYDVSRRVLSLCSQIFRYAIPIGRCEYDITAGLNSALVFVKRKNFNCIGTEEFPQLLKDIENHNCHPLTKYALKLIVVTFVRTGELRFAKWSEINFETNEWRIPAERMKMRELHIVPLSNQAIAILKAVKKLKLGGKYIFPNVNNSEKVMSENTMLYALYDMKYEGRMTVHGFRQLASTILNEKGFNPDAIERQLSHAERNNVRRAYNHAQYLNERREMIQWWADYIDRQRDTVNSMVQKSSRFVDDMRRLTT